MELNRCFHRYSCETKKRGLSERVLATRGGYSLYFSATRQRNPEFASALFDGMMLKINSLRIKFMTLGRKA